MRELNDTGSNYVKRTCVKGDLGPCVNSTCSATWPPPRERLQRLLDASFPVLPHQRDVISAMGAQVPPADLIFLAATSENHFEEMQGMISDLHQVVFPWLKENTSYSYRLIVYDLGLQNTSAKSLQTKCQCDVLQFPFSSLPEVFGQLKTFQWKPVIIKAHVSRCKLLIYADSCVRYHVSGFQHVLQRALARGLLILHNSFMLPAHVMPPMLTYFRVDPCLLGPFYEFAGGFIMVKNEALVINKILDFWLACAFAPDCIYPGDNWKSLRYCHTTTGYSKCHRFDQAAIGIILVSLFDRKSSSFVEAIGHVKFLRGDKVQYFPDS
ncbi:uncharacterized protein LOC112575955 isoform X2 [Pomacea canaliculata]|nr:uncharacterized protein LOC112575955 isoform X2 [Pomacea canaliculata]